jgi:hypothetical protein
MSSDPRYAEWTPEQIWQAKVPDDVASTLRDEERPLYHEAFSKGVSPGRMIQRYAQARGFRPQPAAPAAAAASGAPDKAKAAPRQALLNGGLDAQPLAA